MLKIEAEIGKEVRINNPIRKEHGVNGFIVSRDSAFDMVWVRIPYQTLLCEYRELDYVIP